MWNPTLLSTEAMYDRVKRSSTCIRKVYWFAIGGKGGQQLLLLRKSPQHDPENTQFREIEELVY